MSPDIGGDRMAAPESAPEKDAGGKIGGFLTDSGKITLTFFGFAASATLAVGVLSAQRTWVQLLVLAVALNAALAKQTAKTGKGSFLLAFLVPPVALAATIFGLGGGFMAGLYILAWFGSDGSAAMLADTLAFLRWAF